MFEYRITIPPADLPDTIHGIFAKHGRGTSAECPQEGPAVYTTRTDQLGVTTIVEELTDAGFEGVTWERVL